MIRALRIFEVKITCNLSDRAFYKTMEAVDCDSISLYKVKKFLKYIVPLEPKWVDMCIKSCCAFIGKYKDCDRCTYCKTSRYTEISKNNKTILKSRCQAAYFSIIERFKLQY
jgi:hypothetical protein